MGRGGTGGLTPARGLPAWTMGIGDALLLLGLLFLAQGAQAAGERRSCTATLASLNAQSEFQAAALCRASLPGDVCRQALLELGSFPWSERSVSSTCEKWERLWAPALRAEEARVLANQNGPQVDSAVRMKLEKRNPWEYMPAGINAFLFPIFQLSASGPEIDTTQGNLFKTYPDRPDWIPVEAVLGVVRLRVPDDATLAQNPFFQQSLLDQVSAGGKVNISRLLATSVHATPDVAEGVLSVSGTLEVFFVVFTDTINEARGAVQSLQQYPLKDMQAAIRDAMTTAGAGDLSILVESLEVSAAADLAPKVKVTAKEEKVPVSSSSAPPPPLPPHASTSASTSPTTSPSTLPPTSPATSTPQSAPTSLEETTADPASSLAELVGGVTDLQGLQPNKAEGETSPATSLNELVGDTTNLAALQEQKAETGEGKDQAAALGELLGGPTDLQGLDKSPSTEAVVSEVELQKRGPVAEENPRVFRLPWAVAASLGCVGLVLLVVRGGPKPWTLDSRTSHWRGVERGTALDLPE